MAEPAFFDNKTAIVKDDLVRQIQTGGRVSVAASVFSMYAYQELCEQLEGIDEFRFLFTSQTFTKERAPKEKREFYIPRLSREQGLYGTEFDIRLRNELTQKAVAAECAAWIRKKAVFKSFGEEGGMGANYLVIEGGEGGERFRADGPTSRASARATADAAPEPLAAYLPFNGFTTSELGTEKSAASYSAITRLDAQSSRSFLEMFNRAWDDGRLHDVTEAVIDGITAMYQENAPELIYYAALYRIFNEFLDDVSEDVLPNEGVGFRESVIWGKLYDFQRDAVLAIINKLETYNGCILADSVGLGKTFTALAVVKYYEARNRNVLVLCPKKLKDNWITFRTNVVNNPIAADRLRYDVAYHTDLLRTRGDTVTGIPLDRINWGAYDLVVIDESHNFRNGADSANKAEDKMNRYQVLMEKVVKRGVKTKVLMLSATPVNNRFRDLRNQLALAYSGDPSQWEGKLRLNSDIDTVFRLAQRTYTSWTKLPPEARTTETLTNMLDFDFFEVLDQVTVARSRKHIQRYYDMRAIGPFPARNRPISRRPKLSTLESAINYREIYEQLEAVSLAVYIPSQYLQPSKAAKYARGEHKNLTSAGRENGLRKLMTANLLKRLESSVWSFRLTIQRVMGVMEDALETIEEFKRNRMVGSASACVYDAAFGNAFDLDPDDEETFGYEVGGNTKILLEDMDWLSWERDIDADLEQMHLLLSMVADIDAPHDAKLLDLCVDIREKVENPINAGNRKVLIFTAFSDTAEYLYEHVSAFAKRELGLETGIITGGTAKSTLKKVPSDMNGILTCFSPASKERDVVAPRLAGCDIDIVIATDCISEGQNLQDCDYLVNYDIHWNPVRIVQRFGRVDRIGSKNARIQLVNYWPDVELDEYIKLKARVEERMRITVMTSTGDDDYINEDEQGDLEYRKRQLEQMRDEVLDLEEVQGGVSITDLGLNEFRMDLVGYFKENPDIDRLPTGIHAVVEGDEPGVIFVLRNVRAEVNREGKNHLHPFYVIYVGQDGEVIHGHLQPKPALDAMRLLCRGKAEPDADLCREFNCATKNGKNMREVAALLKDAVASVVDAKEEEDIDSFFGSGTTTFLEGDIAGLDDFELICFLVVSAPADDGEAGGEAEGDADFCVSAGGAAC